MNTTGNYELNEIQKLHGHGDRVWALAWNPVVPWMLASCSGDRTVRIWQKIGTSWECTDTVDDRHTRTIRSCAWSPCGKFLATAGFDQKAIIWGKSGNTFKFMLTLVGHANEVKCVSWSSCGSMLATCGRDLSVLVYKMPEILPEQDYILPESDLLGHTQDVKMVQWHPSMKVLVSVSYDNSIKVWAEDACDDWQCLQTLDESCCGHSSTVWAIHFHEKGNRMVTCSDDLTLKIWDSSCNPTQTSNESYGPWKHLCTLSGYHDRTIFSVHWSRDGIIASGAADDAICIFAGSLEDLGNGPSDRMLLKKKAHNMDVNSVQWHPMIPGLLASASDDGTVKIWSLISSS